MSNQNQSLNSATNPQARIAWRELQTIPLDDRQRIQVDFGGFPTGTYWNDILDWFEFSFGVSVARNLMH